MDLGDLLGTTSKAAGFAIGGPLGGEVGERLANVATNQLKKTKAFKRVNSVVHKASKVHSGVKDGFKTVKSITDMLGC